MIHYSFYCPNVSTFGYWQLSSMALVFLLYTCIIMSLGLFIYFSTSLLSVSKRSSRLILTVFWSSTRINHFSKEPCFSCCLCVLLKVVNLDIFKDLSHFFWQIDPKFGFIFKSILYLHDYIQIIHFWSEYQPRKWCYVLLQPSYQKVHDVLLLFMLTLITWLS